MISDTFGADTRPDFFERKMCNFIEQMKLCLTNNAHLCPQQIEQMKASSKEPLDGMISDDDFNFQPEKCPSYRYFTSQSYTNKAASNVVFVYSLIGLLVPALFF